MRTLLNFNESSGSIAMEKLETRPLYSIGTVSRLSGIKADTLRVWERRYGLGASGKSSGGRREYTQSDLEHLQIIAALRDQGTRIGDIAKRDRKTLEMTLNRTNANDKCTLPTPRLKVLFAGQLLAGWLDSHPGCIANVSAYIARMPLEELMSSAPEALGEFDALILECPNLSENTLSLISALRSRTSASYIAACNGDGNHWPTGEIDDSAVDLLAMPPLPQDLGATLNSYVTRFHTSAGDTNTGELVNAKPRQYSDGDLSHVLTDRGDNDIAVPEQLSRLIRELNQFEALASKGEIDTWQDSAVQSCVFAYTNQARWLMEKAMGAVLDHPSDK